MPSSLCYTDVENGIQVNDAANELGNSQSIKVDSYELPLQLAGSLLNFPFRQPTAEDFLQCPLSLLLQMNDEIDNHSIKKNGVEFNVP